MLYLIYGTSAAKRHQARQDLFLKIGITSGDVVSKSAHESSIAELEQIAGGSSLFENTMYLSLEYPFLNESFGETVLDFAPRLVQSVNTVFVIERELTKDIIKSFEKSGATIILCDEPKEAKKKEFNIFSITNAFSAKDKKGTWLLYREAILHEEAPEAIIGILFWAIKDMIIKKRFSVWKKNELDQASRELVRIVHGAHNGLFDIEEELERFVLSKI